MDLFPAIDLLDGRCVRLYQGDYERETVYGDDPVAQARTFADAGAPWIHVVDLDAARTGEPANRDAIAAICAAVDVPVQTGGGVRSVDAAEALFAAGVHRVVLGTAALENPGLVRRLADRHPVAVGLDVRGREVAIRGWEAGSGADIVDLLDEFEGSDVAAFVVTQISRDGTLDGPDLAGLSLVVSHTTTPIVASGGVGTLDDIRRLAQLHDGARRLAGVIVGRALYEGRFTVDEALEAAASGNPPAEPPRPAG